MAVKETTMSDKFDNAWNLLMELEGGIVDNPDDPGGLTKWGISQRSHPDVDIVNLTEEGAKAIYKEGYWPPYMDHISDWGVSAELFEQLVNMRPKTAVKIWQTALNYLGAGLTVDGEFGPVTLRNINSYSRRMRIPLLKALNGVQFMHFFKLVEGTDWADTFARGWLRRIEHPS